VRVETTGVPHAICRIDGAGRIIVNAWYGWLVPAGDVEALTEAVRDCLEAPVDMLTRIGNAAREHVLKCFYVGDHTR
jgi:glycosyltransferase involved in cell wall biosynthesis